MRHPSVVIVLVLLGLIAPLPLRGDALIAAREARERGPAATRLVSGHRESPPVPGSGELIGQSHLVATGVIGQPVITADGSTVVFNVVAPDGTNDLWSWSEGEVTRITTDGDPKFRPRVSADGKVVVWSQKMDSVGRKDWDPMMLRDGVVTDLWSSPLQSLYVDVSDDGERIVWDQDGKGAGRDLDLWMYEGGEARQLTHLDGDQGYPVISGDGSTIVFRDFSLTPEPHIGLMLRWRDGELEPVLAGEGRNQLQPAVSADGRTVYYTLVEGDWRETIWRVVEGQEPEPVAGVPGLSQAVTVSADGTVFAFMNVSREGASWDVLFSPGEGLHPVVQGRGNQLNSDIDAGGHNLMWMDSYSVGDEEHRIYRYRWTRP